MVTKKHQEKQKATMKLVIATCICSAATLATTAEARGPYGATLTPRGYYYNRRPKQDSLSLMGDVFSMPMYFNSFLRRQHQYDHPLDSLLMPSSSRSSSLMERSTSLTSPRFEVHDIDDGQSIELTLELPGVEAKDLSIELEGDNMLRISGSRKYRSTTDGSTTTTEAKFDKMFQLDPANVDISNLSVTLSSGILRITAPKREKITRNIPITSTLEEETPIDVAITEKSQTTTEHVAPDNEVQRKGKNSVASVNEDHKVVEEVDGISMTEEDM